MPNSSEFLTESRERVVPLSDEAGAALQDLGRRLASKIDWWGGPVGDQAARSVVDAFPHGSGNWRVLVRDAVGVIVLDEVQLHILPKIPADHFLFLAEHSQVAPRLSDEAGTAGAGPLWELVLRWFVTAAEHLLRLGLVRDYAGITDTLPVIRGQIDALGAARRYYAGTLLFDCSFEDFVENNPPNRLIRAAAQHTAAAPLDETLRRRARRILSRMEAVTTLRLDDRRWRPDRRTVHYSSAVSLARHVLQAAGRSLEAGRNAVWTFLIRTPELVEAGIRGVLQNRLGHEAVVKKGFQLSSSTLSFNPDLRFWNDRAVADVKYKISTGQWEREDLYQVLAFAAALRCTDAAVLNFGTGRQLPDSELRVGDYRVRQISWPAIGDLSADAAAREFTGAVSSWLQAAPLRPAP